MSLLRLGIRSRIYGGWAFSLLGLALAGRGVWNSMSIDQQVARMSTLSDSNTGALRIARLMEAKREASLRLKFSSAAGSAGPERRGRRRRRCSTCCGRRATGRCRNSSARPSSR